MSAPANWYPDPADPALLRYWDGAAWTEHTHPLDVAAQPTTDVDPSGPDSTPKDAAAADPAPMTRRERRRLEEAATGAAEPDVEPESEPQVAASRTEPTPLAAPATAAIPVVPVPFTASTPVTVPFFGARKVARELAGRVAALEDTIAKYGLLDLVRLDEEKSQRRAEIAADQDAWRQESARRTAELDARIAAAHGGLAELEQTIAARRGELAALETELIGVRVSAEIQELGLYDYEHPAESSADLATKLESLRTGIKAAVRDKRAANASSGFTFNGSEAKGRKFVSDMTKILLRAYNAEAENCVKAVRAGNLHVAQARLSKAAEMIERQGAMISLTIDPEFHRMRLSEIQLANDHLQLLQREKELERARREELREQRKAEQELAREHERLDKERAHYVATLAALEANGDEAGAERLRAKLVDVDRAIHDVDYRAANIRAGYVYVISNVGAFGESMVKIGMTRRLEPMDRVNELGDASVPFRFDVHALFFADDAVGVEAMLHQTFAESRVNRVNLRREFFYVTPDQVLAALKSHAVEVVEFRTEAVSEEFRLSRELATV